MNNIEIPLNLRIGSFYNALKFLPHMKDACSLHLATFNLNRLAAECNIGTYIVKITNEESVVLKYYKLPAAEQVCSITLDSYIKHLETKFTFLTNSNN